MMWSSIGLSAENWKKASPGGRLASLQVLENRLAQIQKRPPCQLRVSSWLGSDRGRVDQNNPTRMEINPRLLDDENPYGAVDTVAHEGRHAYQIDAVLFPDQHRELSQAQIAAWSENLPNYLTVKAVGRQAYLDQPVEVDARAYAADIIAELYTYKDRGLGLDKAFIDAEEFFASSENLQNPDYAKTEQPDGWVDQPPISRTYEFEPSAERWRWLSLDETPQESDVKFEPDVETESQQDPPTTEDADPELSSEGDATIAETAEEDQAEPAPDELDVEPLPVDEANLEEPTLFAPDVPEESAETREELETELRVEPDPIPEASLEAGDPSEFTPETESISEPAPEHASETVEEKPASSPNEAETVADLSDEAPAVSDPLHETPNEAEDVASTEPQPEPATADGAGELHTQPEEKAESESRVVEAEDAVQADPTAPPETTAEPDAAIGTKDDPAVDDSPEFAAMREAAAMEAEERAPRRAAEPEADLENAKTDAPDAELSNQPQTTRAPSAEPEAAVAEADPDLATPHDVEPEPAKDVAAASPAAPEASLAPEPDAPAAVEGTNEPVAEEEARIEPEPRPEAEGAQDQSLPLTPASQAAAAGGAIPGEQPQPDAQPEKTDDIALESGGTPDNSPPPEASAPVEAEPPVNTAEALGEVSVELVADTGVEPHPAPESEVDTSPDFAAMREAAAQEAESRAPPPPPPPPSEAPSSGMSM